MKRVKGTRSEQEKGKTKIEKFIRVDIKQKNGRSGFDSVTVVISKFSFFHECFWLD